MKKYIVLKELETQYANHTLTEYLKTLSHEELALAHAYILQEYIDGVKANICDAIINEFEYRSDEDLKNSRTK